MSPSILCRPLTAWLDRETGCVQRRRGQSARGALLQETVKSDKNLRAGPRKLSLSKGELVVAANGAVCYNRPQHENK